MKPSGHTAVMAQRTEPPDSLDWFATPPWATRALIECVLDKRGIGKEALATQCVWEPAAGEGHMAEVLREYFAHVYASDVHDYGRDYPVGSFVGEGIDCSNWPTTIRHYPHWIATNPPFNLAAEFAERALAESDRGVALFARTAWLEGGDRYRSLFSQRPPTTVALFSERVPLTKGGWNPDASTATSYAWVIWEHEARDRATTLVWIPPGQRKALERPDDRKRFAR
jgi:hypothetical protein